MKAIVIGATGLVGRHLTELLLANPNVAEVVVFVRRAMDQQHPKLRQHIIDYNQPEQWQQMVQGDVLFSSLGTTLKQAGSKPAQYLVDHTYQYNFAAAASRNRVPVYVLVSAAGVSESSMIFYNRMKAELERDVKQLQFNSINIIQPGLLTGERTENRAGEKIGYVILNAINAMGLLKKYKPIKATTVARSMLNAALNANPGVNVFTLNEVFELAEDAKHLVNMDPTKTRDKIQP